MNTENVTHLEDRSAKAQNAVEEASAIQQSLSYHAHTTESWPDHFMVEVRIVGRDPVTVRVKRDAKMDQTEAHKQAFELVKKQLGIG